MYLCEHVVFLLSSGSVASGANDMYIKRCAACRYAQAIQTGITYLYTVKQSSEDAR